MQQFLRVPYMYTVIFFYHSYSAFNKTIDNIAYSLCLKDPHFKSEMFRFSTLRKKSGSN